jgi:hypothetical protein
MVNAFLLALFKKIMTKCLHFLNRGVTFVYYSENNKNPSKTTQA